MRLHAVTPQELPDLWPLIRERVASCCARSGGKYEPLDVLLNCLSRRMDVWLARDDAVQITALAVTEIVVYPRITVCRLLACTGDDARRWIDLLAPLEAWAKAQGCAVMEPICRPGWERHLKPKGYQKTHVVLEKSL